MFKTIFQALTGYIGSSENPEKISERFVGVTMGVIIFLAPYIASLLGVEAEAVTAQVQPIAYLVAIFWYLFGAIRACWLAAKASPTVGAFLKF